MRRVFLSQFSIFPLYLILFVHYVLLFSLLIVALYAFDLKQALFLLFKAERCGYLLITVQLVLPENHDPPICDYIASLVHEVPSLVDSPALPVI